MKLGVFLQAQWGSAADVDEGIAGLVQQAVLADELGYDWLGFRSTTYRRPMRPFSPGR